MAANWGRRVSAILLVWPAALACGGESKSSDPIPLGGQSGTDWANAPRVTCKIGSSKPAPLDEYIESLGTSPADVLDAVEGTYDLECSDGRAVAVGVVRGKSAAVATGHIDYNWEGAPVHECTELLIEVDASVRTKDGAVRAEAATLEVLNGSAAFEAEGRGTLVGAAETFDIRVELGTGESPVSVNLAAWHEGEAVLDCTDRETSDVGAAGAGGGSGVSGAAGATPEADPTGGIRKPSDPEATPYDYADAAITLKEATKGCEVKPSDSVVWSTPTELTSLLQGYWLQCDTGNERPPENAIGMAFTADGSFSYLREGADGLPVPSPDPRERGTWVWMHEGRPRFALEWSDGSATYGDPVFFDSPARVDLGEMFGTLVRYEGRLGEGD